MKLFAARDESVCKQSRWIIGVHYADCESVEGTKLPFVSDHASELQSSKSNGRIAHMSRVFFSCFFWRLVLSMNVRSKSNISCLQKHSVQINQRSFSVLNIHYSDHYSPLMLLFPQEVCDSTLLHWNIHHISIWLLQTWQVVMIMQIMIRLLAVSGLI